MNQSRRYQDTKSVTFNLNFVVICSLHGAPCQGKTKRHQHHYIRNCWSKDDCLSPCVQVYRCTVLYNTPTAWLTQLYNRRLSARVLAGTLATVALLWRTKLQTEHFQNRKLNIFPLLRFSRKLDQPWKSNWEVSALCLACLDWSILFLMIFKITITNM